MKPKKSESRSDRLGRFQSEVFAAWKQLEAFGFLLERQGDACEGTPELQGLGLGLTEMSERLYEVWKGLDVAEFPPEQHCRWGCRKFVNRKVDFIGNSSGMNILKSL